MNQQRTAPMGRALIAMLFSLLLAVSLIPFTAIADEVPTTNTKGESGSCTWEVDASGKLTVKPANGTSGELSYGAFPQWLSSSTTIRSAVFEKGVSSGANLSMLFMNQKELKTIDFSGLETSSATNMLSMLTGCSALSEVKGLGSNFDTRNVTSMSSMFSECASLTSLDLSHFNTAKVTNMSAMFDGCENLREVNLSSFTTGNVEGMAEMFNDCKSLQKLDLSKFDTSKVIDMTDMFTGCEALEEIAIGKDFSFKGAGTADATGCMLPDGDWLSKTYNKAFTSVQIADTRNKMADTYVKHGIPEPEFPNDSDKKDVITIYRVYNPNSGEHFYTKSAYERDHLVKVGWRNENIGWYAPTSGSDVYRLYNPNAGGHFFTTSAYERDYLVKVGWNYEGVSWFSYDEKTTPLYRVYNPNQYSCNHFWTASAAERDYLVKLGWRNEGIGWYAAAK